MHNFREEYLAEVRRELAREMSPVEVAMRLAEIDCHLTDAVEARVELGMSLSMAEQEAIESFGVARQVARSLTQRPGLRRLGWIGGVYFLTAIFLLAGWRVMETFPNLSLYLFMAVFLLGVGFAVSSFRTRRPEIIRVFACGVVGTGVLWAVAGSTWLILGPYGGKGLVPRASVDRYVVEARQRLSGFEADGAALEAGMRSLRTPAGIESLRVTDGYRAPVVKAGWGYKDHVSFMTVRDGSSAKSAWIDVNRRFGWRSRVEDETASLAAISQAQAEPIHNFLSAAPQIVPPGIGFISVAALVDLTFGGLGATFATIRRRRGAGGLHA